MSKVSDEYAVGQGLHAPHQVSTSNPAKSAFVAPTWDTGQVATGTGFCILSAQGTANVTVQLSCKVPLGITSVKIPTGTTGYILYNVTLTNTSSGGGGTAVPILGHPVIALTFGGNLTAKSTGGVFPLQPSINYASPTLVMQVPVFCPSTTTGPIQYTFVAWAMVTGVVQ